MVMPGTEDDSVLDWMPRLLEGLQLTVLLTLGGFAVALVVGLVIAVMRLNPKLYVLYIPSTIFVEVFRGTPLLLQLFFAYFALPSIGISFSPLVAGILGLGFNTGAYLSEIFRGSVLSVDKGQWEATEALGLSWASSMRYAILPQAFRIALPPTGNYAVSLFKDSALAATVSVSELLFTGQMIGAETFQYMKVYAVIAVMYLAVSYPTSLGLRKLERRIDTTRPGRKRKRLLDEAGANA